ncbi:MAG: preprotein translocase subunit SecA [Candidatus Portnoybacteria bacterium]
MSFLNKFLGDSNKKEVEKISPLVEKINQLEPRFESPSDEEIKEKTKEFQKRLKEGETLDDILVEAFALVREASKRTISQRHYDVQLVGGIVLHQGKIAEMKTGEGKTLAATLAVYLNALNQKGVHLITVNDYLARRDTNWMGPIYQLLGLSCACLNHEKAYLFSPKAKPDGEEVTVEMENLKEIPRKEAYAADILYGTNNEFGFDYLRDNMAPSLEMMVQREPHFAIIDEVDSVLIDEARTPLIISMPDMESTKLYQQFSTIVPQLKESADYSLDEKAKAVSLTEEGISKVEKILGLENIYEEGGIRYVHHLEQALRAKIVFKRDRDYVVKNDQVIIVDEFTGRLMPGRRYSDGLHQAIEAKEKVFVQHESRTLASITFQNYFRMYPKLSGMTGTALTSAEEFHKVYNLDAVVVPTNKEMIRKDLPDSIYKNEKGKFIAITKEIKQRHQKGQPILVGTVSIEKNELLSKYLKKEGVPHQVLNAKNHEQEAGIISQAGEKGAVTVATNMAGRGVDIVLGQGVVDLGGLHVLGTERHEARRIDNQLRGRAGRQGDPGSSQFFVSLEDDLMRIFGGDRVRSLMETMKVPEDQPIENKLISRAIESAQGKIEGHNFDIRKHVLEYDDVLNKQREVIYKKRREILNKENLREEMIEMIKKEAGSEKEKESLEAYRKKEEELGENMRQVEKFVMMRSLDMLWMDHLDNMGYLRDSVRLRAYGQKDPLVEYKNEGMSLFKRLLDSIQSTAVDMVFKVGLAPAEKNPHVRHPMSNTSKVGRNSPCPCGSGKKHKKCHGK